MREQIAKVNGFRNGHDKGRCEGAPVLVTGGAGFIGTNVADRLLKEGRQVVLLDNMSRGGVDQNALWLQRRYGRRVRIIVGDIRSQADVRRALEGVAHVFHFAAQVAVTTSLLDPRTDFDINAGGTLNLLEEMRTMPKPPSILYTSTNKVYGGLEDVPLRKHDRRYEPVDPLMSGHGIGENRCLDFHTPYGCSKGAAEQYVLDYGRSFGVPTCVFRMSCIYGPHQFGTEDQGWVAHFLIRALQNKPITLYGDGMQVRDILSVEDLTNAMLAAWDKIHVISGQAFNIGGGVTRSVSLLELIDLIARLNGARPRILFDTSRTGDQRYYVSDTSKFQLATGWTPQIGPREGVKRLLEWLIEARQYSPVEIAVS